MEKKEENSYPASKMKTVYGQVVVDESEVKDDDETENDKNSQLEEIKKKTLEPMVVPEVRDWKEEETSEEEKVENGDE